MNCPACGSYNVLTGGFMDAALCPECGAAYHEQRWVCAAHGVVVPVDVRYSYPAQGRCPECGVELLDRIHADRLRGMGEVELVVATKGTNL